ncbi:hypothetical protein [Novosphingobium sp.]|uniref:hypothetical protein n=1 Tax=Novosphingobium sp. TaxID=1874826 RepID=UPI001D6D2C61|nr:hypothetical protein [Novosphingobium sp.]MBX9662333.1 hypothetical protein [Novosphingobium sp.]
MIAAHRVCLAILGVTLAACSTSSPAPISEAASCIRSSVLPYRSLSIPEARTAIDRCQKSLAAWSRTSIEKSFGKTFDASDPRMADAFRKHQAALYRRWMKELSADYATAHSGYE